MPESDDDHVYTFGPSALSTPQRWRARFDAYYQVRDSLKTASEVQITPDDFKKYEAVNPGESAKLKRIQDASKVTGLGTALGLFGGGFQMYRWTRSPPLLVVGTFLSTFAGHVVADDVGGWIYGTYKLDIAGTSKTFVDWVANERKATTTAHAA